METRVHSKCLKVNTRAWLCRRKTSAGAQAFFSRLSAAGSSAVESSLEAVGLGRKGTSAKGGQLLKREMLLEAMAIQVHAHFCTCMHICAHTHTSYLFMLCCVLLHACEKGFSRKPFRCMVGLSAMERVAYLFASLEIAQKFIFYWLRKEFQTSLY